jgi:hypothetical protein
VDHDLIYRQPSVGACMGADDLIHLSRKTLGGLRPPIPGGVIKEGRTRAEFLHQRVEGDEERGVLVFPHDHMAIGAEQAGAEGVVGVPQLHVGGVGGVADVERVKHEEAAVIPCDQRIGQFLPAIVAHLAQVRQGQARRLPFAERKLRRANFDAVIVIGRAVAKGGAARGVDLAAVGVVLVHGGPPGHRLNGSGAEALLAATRHVARGLVRGGFVA